MALLSLIVDTTYRGGSFAFDQRAPGKNLQR